MHCPYCLSKISFHPDFAMGYCDECDNPVFEGDALKGIEVMMACQETEKKELTNDAP